MSLDTVLYVLLVLVILSCFFFLIVAVATYFYLKKQIAKNLRPNPHEIHRDLDRLRRAHPHLNGDQLAVKHVNTQALLLGMIGAASGLGGIFFELIGTPIDISMTTLRQMKMVHIITAIYGNDNLDPETLEIRYMSLVLGSAGMAKLIPRIIIKFIGESIPGVGSIVGFCINAFLTKSIGEAAIAWNKGQTLRQRAAGFKDRAIHARDAAWHALHPSHQPLLTDAQGTPANIPQEMQQPPALNQRGQTHVRTEGPERPGASPRG